jgi:aldose 1-epimerase
MRITREKFGETSTGKAVSRYILENQQGVKAGILDFGAVLSNLWVPDGEGRLDDVVLGFDTVAEYEENIPSYGAIVGRYANRISGAGFDNAQGIHFSLDANDGENCLHSGFDRFNYHMYDVTTCEDEGRCAVIFSRRSPAGEQGFPGNLSYSIEYWLTEENTLILSYRAVSDDATPINLTNHSYFNLGPGGHKAGSVLEQEVWIDSSQYTPLNAVNIPTGECLTVEGTPFDFRTRKPLARDISVPEFPGYDHNFVLKTEGEVKKVATLWDTQSGRQMNVYTDQPGLQIYTAPYMDDTCGKEQQIYHASEAICFEAQNFPNAVNTKGFPNAWLQAGDEYTQTTVYEFRVFQNK